MEKLYFSLAAGSQIKTARIMEYPYILINFMTQTNTPPKYQYESLFIDCGGFHSSMKHRYYTKSDVEYLNYIQKWQPDFFALRDYPCEPELLKKHDLTATDQIHKTLSNHIRLLDTPHLNDIKGTPIPVIQGWKLEDYLYCIDLYREHDLITDYMAVGSVCRRGSQKQITKIISTIHRELPDTRLHGFGISLNALKNQTCWESLYSVDSGAWDYTARWEKLKQGLKGSDMSLKCAIEFKERIDHLRCFYANQSKLEV